MATLVAVGGVAAAAWAGETWQHQVEREARRQEAQRTRDVTERAVETIRRGIDVTRAFRASMAAQPDMDDVDFQRWLATLDPYPRLPGLLAFGYAARADQGSESHLSVSCPLRLTSASDPATVVPTGTDLCGPSLGLRTAFGRAVDTGELIMGVVGARGATQRPLLVGGAVFDRTKPQNVFVRRQATLGWAGALFDGDELVRQARGASHAGMWLRISHQAVGEAPEVIGTVGTPPRGDRPARTAVVDGDGRWLIAVSQTRNSGPSPLSQGGAVFLAGSIVALLLSALVVVLGSARDRALRLVDTKTDELLHQALHDPLTDLPNRTLILNRVEQLLDGGGDGDGRCALMFIDLDDFKDINDTLGHGIGDLVLQEVGRRLLAAVRPGDTVGRLGGDEFVIVLPHPTGATVVAERVLTALGVPHTIPGFHPLHVGASIGIGTASAGPTTAGDLLREADVALYSAKASGRGCVVVFEPEMAERVQERLDLEAALRVAVADQQLFLVYQPILDLRGMQVTGVEALVRWRHPQRGVLTPDTFIPVAEQAGLIGEIGRWVLLEACRQTAAWHRLGAPLHIAVNVSARQLDTDDLIHDVRAALDDSGLQAAT